MFPLRTIGTHIVLLVAFVGAGCVAVTERRTTVPLLDAGFPPTAAAEIFRTGYTSIDDRYLEPVSLPRLAVAGMRGLESLDRSLTIAVEGKAIVIRKDAAQLSRVAAPPSTDAAVWADMTAKVALAARQASPALAAASAEEIYEAVFDGALATLDGFSRYASADKARSNRFRRDGYGGIGIRLKIKQNTVTITDVSSHSPAERIGLRSGDRITEIDGTPVDGLNDEDIGNRLVGPAGSWVELVVQSEGGKTRQYHVHRAYIIPETISATRLDGIIQLTVTGFNQGTAGSMWSILYDAFSDQNGRLKGVVLDLRGNPGGLLHQSVKMVDLFLENGSIVATRGRHPESIQSYDAGGRDVLAGLPLVVLVDGRSASAAEIVAAALQDRGRAVVIGSSSYGKGTVQTVITLPNRGELILTWSRLILPSGRLLADQGVHPTLCTSGLDGEDRTQIEQLFARTVAAVPAPLHLRSASCPSEPRRTGIELELARRLLLDRIRYMSLLDAAPHIAEAAN